MSIREHIERAIAIVGSETKLGELCGCSQHKIWLAKTEKCPVTAELALRIHHATDGQVPASDLRPDLWMAPEHVPPLAPPVETPQPVAVGNP